MANERLNRAAVWGGLLLFVVAAGAAVCEGRVRVTHGRSRGYAGPAEEITSSICEYLKTHPDEAAAHYALGRLYELQVTCPAGSDVFMGGFAKRADGLYQPQPVYGEGTHFDSLDQSSMRWALIQREQGGTTMDSGPVALRQPALDAVAEYRRAIALAKENDPSTLAFYHLRLGRLLEEGMKYAVAWEAMPDAAPAAAALTAEETAEVRRLVGKLAAEDFEVRDAAERRLMGMMDRARAELLKLVDGVDPETEHRIRRLLDRQYTSAWRREAVAEYRQAFSYVTVLEGELVNARPSEGSVGTQAVRGSGRIVGKTSAITPQTATPVLVDHSRIVAEAGEGLGRLLDLDWPCAVAQRVVAEKVAEQLRKQVVPAESGEPGVYSDW